MIGESGCIILCLESSIFHISCIQHSLFLLLQSLFHQQIGLTRFASKSVTLLCQAAGFIDKYEKGKPPPTIKCILKEEYSFCPNFFFELLECGVKNLKGHSCDLFILVHFINSKCKVTQTMKKCCFSTFCKLTVTVYVKQSLSISLPKNELNVDLIRRFIRSK